MTVLLKRADNGRVRWSATVDFKKYDDSKGLSFGYASFIVDKHGAEIVDHDQDIIEPSELEAASYKWVEESRTIGDMHSKRGAGNLVEAVFLSPEKRRAMGGFDPADQSVGLWIGARWTNPETRAAAAKGLLKQWSISGWAKRIPTGSGNVGKLTGLELDEISGVDFGAGKGVDMALSKRRKEESKMFGKLIFKALAFVPSEDRAELMKKLGGEDGLEGRLAKMASMEDIKSKLTAEEWDLILADFVPSAVDDAQDAAAPPAAPLPPKGRKSKTTTAKAKKDDEDSDDDLDVELTKRDKLIADLQKRQEDFEKREKLSKYRTEVATSSFLKFYPGKIEDTAAALVAADDNTDREAGKRARAAIEKSARALKESSLFKTHGTSRDTDSPSDEGGGTGEDAGPTIMKMIKERVEKSDGKKNFTQALEEIARSRPELYQQYYDERRRRGGALTA